MSQPEFAASTLSNFGCATNVNLAAMVARPEDLVRGQTDTETTDPTTSTKAVDSLRRKALSGSDGLGSFGGN